MTASAPYGSNRNGFADFTIPGMPAKAGIQGPKDGEAALDPPLLPG